METIILNNARYWRAYLDEQPATFSPSDREIQGIAKALSALTTLPLTPDSGNRATTFWSTDLWDVTLVLLQALDRHFLHQGQWHTWEHMLLHMINKAEGESETAQPAPARLYAHLGRLYRRRGDDGAAIDAYLQAWQHAKAVGNQRYIGIATVNLGGLHCKAGYYRRAETLIRGALGIFESLDDVGRQGYAYNDLGHLHMAQLNWDDAHTYLHQASTLFRQADDPSGLASSQINLGIVAIYTDNPNQALEHFANARRYYESIDDGYNVAKTHLNAGYIYRRQEDLEAAEAACLRAEDILKDLGGELDLARTRHNLGMVYAKTGDWKEGALCFHRAIEYWRVRDDARNLANSLGELGQLYLLWGRPDLALHCLDEAWTLIEARQESYWTPLQQEIQERRQQARQESR